MGGNGQKINWKNIAHVFYVSSNISLTKKFSLAGTLAYTIGKGEMGQLHFTASDDPFALPGYSFTNLNGTEEFSDLYYQSLETEISAGYQFSKNMVVSLNYWYAVFRDHEEYVYGDLDGTAYTLTGMVTFYFR